MLTNGSLFNGIYKKDLMAEGQLFELTAADSSTYTSWEVKYDFEKDSQNRKSPSS